MTDRIMTIFLLIVLVMQKVEMRERERLKLLTQQNVVVNANDDGKVRAAACCLLSLYYYC